jgi:hypothetical protein
MDTIGLLAAWVGIASFLFAILIAIMMNLFSPWLQCWWANTKKSRAEKRITWLSTELALHAEHPDNRHIAELISLYASMILNLVAAVGLIIISVVILDLGPALLASVLPFNINSKILTRTIGILTFILIYCFIVRLSYLTTRLRLRTFARKPDRADRMLHEISRLRSKFKVAGEGPSFDESESVSSKVGYSSTA